MSNETDVKDISRFARFAVAVDVVALSVRSSRLHVLLIQRSSEPYKGRWALPGVLPRPDEGLDDAVERALRTKAGIVAHTEQLASYMSENRDPRMPTLSVAYLAFVPPDVATGEITRAQTAEWVPVAANGVDARAETPDGSPLAFDHDLMLADAVERARSKLEWTPLATAFVGETFTIPELRAVYETIWGQPLNSGNFHRKAVSTYGFIEPVPGRKGRAQLFRRGSAVILDPPVNRLVTIEKARKAVGLA